MNSGWLPPGCTDKDIDDAAPQGNTMEPNDGDWKIGSDVFSARYYLVDCLIKKWGAVEDAEEIMSAAQDAIDLLLRGTDDNRD